jgi:methionine synthase II (cobalamin-independent)
MKRSGDRGARAEEVFVPAISPTSVEDWQKNTYYKTNKEYLFALADAMREEYKAIVAAGFLVQIDDPHLAAYYVLHPELRVEQIRTWAGSYSFEAANPRHEHEWRVWETVKLPDGAVLIPGVITHSTVLVEHPELVAERIVKDRRWLLADGRVLVQLKRAWADGTSHLLWTHPPSAGSPARARATISGPRPARRAARRRPGCPRSSRPGSRPGREASR